MDLSESTNHRPQYGPSHRRADSDQVWHAAEGCSRHASNPTACHRHRTPPRLTPAGPRAPTRAPDMCATHPPSARLASALHAMLQPCTCHVRAVHASLPWHTSVMPRTWLPASAGSARPMAPCLGRPTDPHFLPRDWAAN